MTKSVIRRLLAFEIDSAIIIGVFTALSYYTTYLYEVSFCKVFNVSEEYITVEFSSILTHMSKVLLIGTVATIIIYISVRIYLLLRHKWIKVALFLYFNIGSFSLFEVIQWYLGNDINTPLILTVIFLNTNLGALFCLLYIKRTRRKAALIARLSPQAEVADRLKSYADKRADAGLTFAVLIVTVFFLLFSSYVGERDAKRKTTFNVFASNPSIVVLRAYGDRLICVEYDYKRLKLTGKVIFYKMDSSPIELTRQTILSLNR